MKDWPEDLSGLCTSMRLLVVISCLILVGTFLMTSRECVEPGSEKNTTELVSSWLAIDICELSFSGGVFDIGDVLPDDLSNLLADILPNL